MLESASALEKKYGFAHEDLVNYMETMMIKRFTTPGVVDPIARVSRETIRKISPPVLIRSSSDTPVPKATTAKAPARKRKTNIKKAE